MIYKRIRLFYFQHFLFIRNTLYIELKFWCRALPDVCPQNVVYWVLPIMQNSLYAFQIHSPTHFKHRGYIIHWRAWCDNFLKYLVNKFKGDIKFYCVCVFFVNVGVFARLFHLNCVAACVTTFYRTDSQHSSCRRKTTDHLASAASVACTLAKESSWWVFVCCCCCLPVIVADRRHLGSGQAPAAEDPAVYLVCHECASRQLGQLVLRNRRRGVDPVDLYGNEHTKVNMYLTWNDSSDNQWGSSGQRRLTC